MKLPVRLSAAMLLLVPLFLLAGCASSGPSEAVKESLATRLVEQGKGPTTQLDFGAIVPGKWTQMLVLCSLASTGGEGSQSKLADLAETATDLLDFGRPLTARELGLTEATQVLIFATPTEIELRLDYASGYYNPGLCTNPKPGVQPDPFLVSRENATMTFEYRPPAEDMYESGSDVGHWILDPDSVVSGS